MRFPLKAHSAADPEQYRYAAYRDCTQRTGICDPRLQEYLVAGSTGLLQAMNHEEVEAGIAHCEGIRTVAAGLIE